MPQVDLEKFRLGVGFDRTMGGGEEGKRLSLSVDELKKMKSKTITVSLQVSLFCFLLFNF